MNRGSYKVRGLPHRDFERSIQGITFRLADAMPAEVLAKWALERDESGSDESRDLLAYRLAKYEDVGKGECLLRDEGCALAVQEALISGHMENYELFAWVVMPNHVHVLFRQFGGDSLGKIVQGWKGRSARSVNALCNRKGRLWSKGYFDRVIRDEAHFWRSVNYIHQNPVKAGLVEEAGEWKFSSCGSKFEDDLYLRVKKG